MTVSLWSQYDSDHYNFSSKELMYILPNQMYDRWCFAIDNPLLQFPAQHYSLQGLLQDNWLACNHELSLLLLSLWFKSNCLEVSSDRTNASFFPVQEPADKVLQSKVDVCSDEAELSYWEGPVVWWRVLLLAHCQQRHIFTFCAGKSAFWWGAFFCSGLHV